MHKTNLVRQDATLDWRRGQKLNAADAASERIVVKGAAAQCCDFAPQGVQHWLCVALQDYMLDIAMFVSVNTRRRTRHAANMVIGDCCQVLLIAKSMPA